MSADPDPVPAGKPVGRPTGIRPADPGTGFPQIRPRSQVRLSEKIIDPQVPVDPGRPQWNKA